MLIIPIGKEHGEVRRQPWVSYAIIASNVVIFFFLWIASNQSEVPGRFEAKAKQITEYIVANPYLTVPPEIALLYGHRDRELLEQVRAGSPPPIEWVVRRQQQKLNGMAEELLAIGRELPILKPGFIPADPDPFAALSSMFVHAGLIHLLGNMLFFFATGPFLEDLLGRVLFTLLYLASGAAALAAHVWQNPGSWAPVVGASGAVAGIMGAFLIRLGTSRIRFLFLPIIVLPWIRFRFLMPAFVFLPVWFIGQFWLATNLAEPGGIALWAHVGGFAFGAVAMLVIVAFGIEKRWIHPAIEKRVAWSQAPELVDAMDALGRGDLSGARRRVEKALRENPSNVDAQRLACDLAIANSDWTAFGREAARLIDLYAARGEKDLALQLIGEAPAQAQGELPLRFHQRAATFLDKNGEERWATHYYRQIARHHASASGSLRALLRLAELLQKEGDLSGAREALRLARAHPECAADWEPVVEGRIATLTGATT
jgi:membrane associated rhomboid family serine protease